MFSKDFRNPPMDLEVPAGSFWRLGCTMHGVAVVVWSLLLGYLLCLLLWENAWPRQLKEGRVYFSSQFEGLVHFGGKLMVAVEWGSWSSCICTWETEVKPGAQLAYSFFALRHITLTNNGYANWLDYRNAFAASCLYHHIVHLKHTAGCFLKQSKMLKKKKSSKVALIYSFIHIKVNLLQSTVWWVPNDLLTFYSAELQWV